MRIFTGPIGLAIVDRLQARMTEVEERLDFAERLFTSREQADQLPEGAYR